MSLNTKQTLVQYRLERAHESLLAAQLLYDSRLYIPAMNRIYYSMFYAVQALLVLNNVSFSKHSQVKGYFNKEFINKGIFSKKYGKLFNSVFEFRQKFDYVDLLIPDQDMIFDYLERAKEFVKDISNYLHDELDME